MDIVKTKRLDHLGLVISTLKQFKVISFIDQQLGIDPQHKVTTGEAIAALILNGLGFVSRPLSLTPQFFQSKALDILFDSNIQADNLNRHRLGRALDDIHQYGCELLFTQIATHICQQINLNTTFTSLDTTTFSVSGNYDQDTDEHEIEITHGYSKDHRPDLKQVVLELLTSQDGGIPLMIKCLDGNANDSQVFEQRCKQLVKSFQQGHTPAYLVADSKLYHQNNQENLAAIKFITRIPKNYQAENEAVAVSLASDQWIEIDQENWYYEHSVNHLSMQQRWLVVYSKSAYERSLKTVGCQIAREYKHIDQSLKKLHKQVFSCESDAKKAFQVLSAGYTYHELNLDGLVAIESYQSVGRPRRNSNPTKQGYQVRVSVVGCLLTVKQKACQSGACYVIGTNGQAEELTSQAVIQAYKNQNASIERGFRFLKDPQFFVSSFYLKKPSRIMSLLLIMTLCLLVYSVMQRHLRQRLKEASISLPNQINQGTQTPTVRWIFQLMEGIDVIYVKIKDKIQRQVMGINQLREQIIQLFYPTTIAIYSTNCQIAKF